MEALPTEIVTDILSQLPVKTLLCCKSVCKSWNSIIKNPKFIKIHLNQTLTSDSDRHLLISIDSQSLFCSSIDHNSISFSELNHPLKPHKHLDIIGSCNGVVCISDLSNNDFFLYNPLTNSHRKLPSIPVHKIDVSGFGYDSKNDDYKVLRIVRGFGMFGRINPYTKAQVYSLNDNSWRCIEDIPHYWFRGSDYGVVVNGALHYHVMEFIVSFDLQTESFSHHIDYPNYPCKISNIMSVSLAELRGCLGLCRLSKFYEHGGGLENGKVELWVMKEYGNKESWVMLFSICEPEIIGGCNYYNFINKPFVYRKDDRRILFEVKNGDCCWYDLESKDVKRIATHGLPKGGNRWGMEIFIGSLVSVQDKDGL